MIFAWFLLANVCFVHQRKVCGLLIWNFDAYFLLVSKDGAIYTYNIKAETLHLNCILSIFTMLLVWEERLKYSREDFKLWI